MSSPERPVVSRYRLRRRVQWYETDTAGIVHFSWFYRYMEEAEHAMWRAAGLSIAPPDADVGFPRVAASFDFYKPLRFEDEFEVELTITEIREKSIHYQADVLKGDDTVASGRLSIACVHKRPGEPMTSVAIPTEIATRFEVAAS